MTIEEIAQQLDNCELLCFANTVKIPESKKEFIQKEIFKLNIYHRTLDVNGLIQTESGKRRSIGDMYLITKYYYPGTTFKEYLKIFFENFKLYSKHNIYYTNYCYDVHKRVFLSANIYYDSVDNVKHKDEYGNTLSDLLKMIKEIVD